MALVVNDEPAVRSVAADYLKKMGYNPVIAADGGAEGLRCLDTHPNDLAIILVDLSMPEVDNKQVVTHALSLNINPTIVFMTGNASSEAGFLEDNPIPVLHKPFTFETLSKVLSE